MTMFRMNFFSRSNLLFILPMVLMMGCSKKDENPARIPGLITKPLTQLEITSAKSGGQIIFDDGSELLSCGICLDTFSNPTINGLKKVEVDTARNFSCSITDLDPNTTYHLRAFATNKTGTGYGNEITFTTPPLTESRDGNIYKTVRIGNQLWMAENLRYLPAVSDTQSISINTSFYYVYGYSGNDVNEAKESENYEKFGVLYNWTASTSVCPAGWHLPSEKDWYDLFSYLGGASEAGIKMKSDYGWDLNGNGSNVSGFT